MRDGDDYVIDGSKRFISQGSVADLITVFAVTETRRRAAPPPPVAASSSRSADAPASASPGSSTRWASAAARRPSSRFDGVRVPAANRVGAEGDGFSTRDADVRPEPARDRRPGRRHRPGRARGRDARTPASAASSASRIGEFQMIGAMLADMDAGTEAARQLLYKACAEIEAGAPDAGSLVGDV